MSAQFRRDAYLRRRNYTERELKAMVAELKRLKPASDLLRLYRRKGEQP